MVFYNNIYPLDELKYAQKWLLHAGLARNVSQTLGDPPRLGCINLRIKATTEGKLLTISQFFLPKRKRSLVLHHDHVMQEINRILCGSFLARH